MSDMECGRKYTVTIVHTSGGQSKPISTGNVLIPSIPQASRAFLAERTFPDGSVAYFLTLLDAIQLDHGEYSCIVSSWFGASFSEITKRTKKTEIVSFPDDTEPICSNNSLKLAFQEESA